MSTLQHYTQEWIIVRCLEFWFRYVYPLSSRFFSYYWSQSILNGPRLFKPDLGPFLLLFLTLNLLSFISPTQPIIIPTWYTSGLQCLNVRYNTIHSTCIVTPSVYSLTGRRWHEARPLEPLSMFPSKLYTLSEIQAKPGCMRPGPFLYLCCLIAAAQYGSSFGQSSSTGTTADDNSICDMRTAPISRSGSSSYVLPCRQCSVQHSGQWWMIISQKQMIQRKQIIGKDAYLDKECHVNN